ncbi:GNAT family N-acetyltransferase [Micromonospora sp. NPDC048935]|uniref:GNAT family N-acetyltransferase n=1 Tax=Micromonospora sp. NPDC048935 TaxID=3364262 RepID=UPI0037139963
MKALTWIPATPADAVPLAALFRQAEAITPVGLDQRAENVRTRLAGLGPDLTRHTRVGLDGEGTVAAYAEVANMGVADGVLRIRLTAVAHPELGGDVRAELHRWLVDRAEQLRRAGGTAQAAMLGTRCAENDPAGCRLLTENGFTLVRHERDLVLAVPELPPAVGLPASLALEPVDERHQELARLAHNETYAQSPSALRPDQRTWPQHAIAHPQFLPDLSCLLLAQGGRDENPVAAFLFALADDDADEPTAILHCLGTRPSWRRRGLATAMILRALHRARSSGFRRLRLQVSDTNKPALALYQRIGFTESGRGYAVLMRQLGGPTAE